MENEYPNLCDDCAHAWDIILKAREHTDRDVESSRKFVRKYLMKDIKEFIEPSMKRRLGDDKRDSEAQPAGLEPSISRTFVANILPRFSGVLQLALEGLSSLSLTRWVEKPAEEMLNCFSGSYTVSSNIPLGHEINDRRGEAYRFLISGCEIPSAKRWTGCLSLLLRLPASGSGFCFGCGSGCSSLIHDRHQQFQPP